MLRRGFLSAIASSLASIPFLGKVFGGEKTHSRSTLVVIGNDVHRFSINDEDWYIPERWIKPGDPIRIKLRSPNDETIRWIPATERLPECDPLAFAATAAGAEIGGLETPKLVKLATGQTGMAYWFHGKFVVGTFDNSVDVTHWAEMPKGPSECQ